MKLAKRARTIFEHAYMLCLCAFLLWDVAYMTEAPWTFAVREVFPVLCWGMAAAGLMLSRLRLRWGWLMAALLVWMAAVSAHRGDAVLQMQLPRIANGAMTFIGIMPTAFSVSRQRMRGYLRVLLACWTVCFTLQALIGLWAALTGHAVFSLRGTWYIGVNLGDHRLYPMAYVTTGAVKLGLSVLLAVLGAATSRRWAGKAAYLLGAAAQMACLALTDCRTAFIAVGAMLGLMGMTQIVRMKRCRIAWLRWLCGAAAMVLATVLVFAALAGTLTALSPHVKNELENITLTELPGALLPQAAAEEGGAVQHRGLDANNLFNDRQLIWQAAIALMSDAPEYLLTGTTDAVAPMLTNLYVHAEGAPFFRHLHSIYLQTLVSWGIPGALLVGVFLLRFLLAAWRLLFRHETPLWERLLPAPVLYVMLCDTVDCFTRLEACTPMLLFACLFAGLSVAADVREVRRT